jgi:hypothetical protein
MGQCGAGGNSVPKWSALFVLCAARLTQAARAEGIKIGMIKCIDPEVLLDEGDVRHQFARYQSQGMERPGDVDGMFDRRYLLTFAQR